MSIACKISWQPPLHGRLVPQTAIARPLEISASASSGDEAVVGHVARVVQHRLGADPGQRHGQAVDRLAAYLAAPAPSRRAR